MSSKRVDEAIATGNVENRWWNVNIVLGHLYSRPGTETYRMQSCTESCWWGVKELTRHTCSHLVILLFPSLRSTWDQTNQTQRSWPFSSPWRQPAGSSASADRKPISQSSHHLRSGLQPWKPLGKTWKFASNATRELQEKRALVKKITVKTLSLQSTPL